MTREEIKLRKRRRWYIAGIVACALAVVAVIVRKVSGS